MLLKDAITETERQLEKLRRLCRLGPTAKAHRASVHNLLSFVRGCDLTLLDSKDLAEALVELDAADKIYEEVRRLLAGGKEK